MQTDQKETDFAALNADEHAGQGGAYEIVDGKRQLVHRTQPTAAPAAEPSVDAHE